MAGVVHLSLRLRGVWVVVLRQAQIEETRRSRPCPTGGTGGQNLPKPTRQRLSQKRPHHPNRNTPAILFLNDPLKKYKSASLGTIGSTPEKTAEFNRRHGPIAVARVLAARLR